MSSTIKGTIAFVLFPERGGYYPTFKLAKELKNHGYRVIYFGTSEFIEDVEKQGLEFRVVLEDCFNNSDFDPLPLSEKMGVFSRIKHQISQIRYKNEVMHRSLADGTLLNEFRKAGVDLLVIDALLNPIAIFCRAEGFKVVALTTELVGVGNHYPPHTSDMIFRENALFSSLLKKYEWLKFRLQRKLMAWSLRFLALIVRARKFDQKITDKFDTLKQDTSLLFVDSEYGKRPLLEREYTLCTQYFDFDKSASKRRKYLGHCIDLERGECKFDFSVLRDDAPLIYCSLGTHVAEYKYSSRFFQELIKFAASRPGLDFIVSLGPGRTLDEFGELSKNVFGAKRLPQLKVLERSSAMITNGGLGTIKECIYFKVPMLVLPCKFDQPGNSARVVYHGIGRRDRINRVSAQSLAVHIDDLVSNPSYKNALARISDFVRKDEEFLEVKSDLLRYLEESSQDQSRVPG